MEAGAGGKGMRKVHESGELEKAYHMAQNEARTAFGDASVYLEKFIERPRHVEIQIAADRSGRVVAFPERDCSVQRRHQKLIEESPSPAVTPGIRKDLMESALRLARACGYTNVGTVEFLLDPKGRFYFLEVNTRLQVEHPVTEFVAGVDLVHEQIRLAAGENLSMNQKEAQRILGHAIEHRINAEDPDTFAPSPGRVDRWWTPGGPGIRMDSHLYPGYTVPSYYDSLIAKLIAFGPDRPQTLRRARRALQELDVEGVRTTVPFHLRVLEHPDFMRGVVDTGFLERMAQEREEKAAR